MASTALDREAVDQHVSRGSDLLKQGKLDEAQKAFRAALLIDEDNPRVLALLGLTHFRAGQFTQAQPIYEELVERAPTDASHRLNLGLVYLKLGESDKAIGSLEASRALDPSQGRAVSYLGLAYARAGRYAEAYRSFLMAGQNDLATEIEVNLTAAERESINTQLAKGLEPRTAPPKPPPKSSAEIPLMSMPAIVIDRGPLAQADDAPPPSASLPRYQPPSVLTEPPPPSMPEIVVDAATTDIHEAVTANHKAPPTDEDTDRAFREISSPGMSAAPAEIVAPAISDSQQFVLPERDAVPAPADGQSVISRAVEVASPSSAAATGVRVTAGNRPPVPLSQLATDALVRPDDGDEIFEVTAAGELVIRVEDRILTRLDGIHITGGELEYEPAMRRSRGSQTDDTFDYGGSRMHAVSGRGYLIAVPGDKYFTAVSLDDDIFYLREDLVFAFDASLRWENGNVPGLRGKLPIVQFRGDGAIALRSSKPLVRVKLPAAGVIYVDALRLAGWIGRVIPRAVVPPQHGPMGEVCVECTGEGVVLVDPSGSLPPVSERERPRTPSKAGTVVKKESRKPSTPPPPPPSSAEKDSSGPIELDVVKNADWLADEEEAGGGGKSGDAI